MPQNLIHMILFSLISGLTEFLPVSVSAHQRLYRIISGFHQEDPWLSLFIHIGALASLLLCCKARLDRISREYRVSRRQTRRRSGHRTQSGIVYDLRLLRSATLPILIGVLFSNTAAGWISGILPLAGMLLVNAIILFVPRFFACGNKDGRGMKRGDGIRIGLLGAVSVIPGLSRIACICSAGTTRGGDRAYILDLALLLSIPAIAVMILLDIYAVAGTAMGLTFVGLLIYLLGAVLSFLGSCLGIAAVRYLAVRTGFVAFGYYSIGLALFSFILYLLV